MEYLFLVVGLYFLIFFFPWYITFYTDNGVLKCYLIMFGFLRVGLDLKKLFKGFATRKYKEVRDLSYIEILENYKKILSVRPIYRDLSHKAKITQFHWYTALPMENLIGLSVLPLYTAFQTYIVETAYVNFKSVKNVDLDTKYNYLNNDIFIYFSCIIKINLAKIISVSVKYITKLPLLLKRTS